MILGIMCLMNLHVIAQDETRYFVIYGDSHQIYNIYEAKNELINAYQDLVIGLNVEEYEKAIDCYTQSHDAVSYQNRTVTLVLGDGSGEMIQGKLKTNYCPDTDAHLETHFFFWELFQ